MPSLTSSSLAQPLHKFFRALDEPELGFLLVCSGDYPVAETLGVGLERTQTLMQGADHCDFQWILTEATEQP